MGPKGGWVKVGAGGWMELGQTPIPPPRYSRDDDPCLTGYCEDKDAQKASSWSDVANDLG